MEKEGGYDLCFVDNKVTEHWICIICHLVLRKPVSFIECGHRLCQSCYLQVKDNANRKNIPLLCPHDRSVVDTTKVYEDKGMSRMIGDLKVKCKHADEDCGWVGELSNLEDHLHKFCQVAGKEKEDPLLIIKMIQERLEKCETEIVKNKEEITTLKEENLRKDREMKLIKEKLCSKEKELVEVNQKILSINMKIETDKKAVLRSDAGIDCVVQRTQTDILGTMTSIDKNNEWIQQENSNEIPPVVSDVNENDENQKLCLALHEFHTQGMDYIEKLIEGGRNKELRLVLKNRPTIFYDKSNIAPFFNLPIHMTVRYDNIVFLKELLKYDGAMIYMRNNIGSTVFHISAAFSFNCFSWLAPKYPNMMEEKNEYGRTPLHYAAYKNSGVVRLLLNFKVNLFEKDIQGKTALDLAEQYQFNKSKKLLCKAMENLQKTQDDTLDMKGSMNEKVVLKWKMKNYKEHKAIGYVFSPKFYSHKNGDCYQFRVQWLGAYKSSINIRIYGCSRDDGSVSNYKNIAYTIKIIAHAKSGEEEVMEITSNMLSNNRDVFYVNRSMGRSELGLGKLNGTGLIGGEYYLNKYSDGNFMSFTVMVIPD